MELAKYQQIYVENEMLLQVLTYCAYTTKFCFAKVYKDNGEFFKKDKGNRIKTMVVKLRPGRPSRRNNGHHNVVRYA